MKDTNSLTSLPCYTSASGVVGASSPANCNFEQNNLCGYIQDPNDQFDWSWQAGSTASSNTGPKNDHTYGTASGECHVGNESLLLGCVGR